MRALHEEGLRIVMLTGDSRATAETVARKLGMDEVSVVGNALRHRRARV
jgi:Cu+-exporting ATPase